MSEEDEIQDGIKDELLMVLKVILTFISSIILAVIGIALGAVIGFYAPYFFCVLMGNGFEQVGWVFLFFTVPIGILAGGGLGCSLPLLFWAKWK